MVHMKDAQKLRNQMEGRVKIVFLRLQPQEVGQMGSRGEPPLSFVMPISDTQTYAHTDCGNAVHSSGFTSKGEATALYQHRSFKTCTMPDHPLYLVSRPLTPLDIEYVDICIPINGGYHNEPMT